MTEKLYGLDFPDLSDGYLALGAVVGIKMLTPDGKVQFRELCTHDLNGMERLGIATSLAQSAHESLRRVGREEDD